MKYQDIEVQKDRFNKVLRERFLSNYPDTFIKCTTRNKEEYESANGAMYSWYMKLVNISLTNLSPKYTQTNEEAINSDWSCIGRFVDDFEKCDNWQSFIFNHITII